MSRYRDMAEDSRRRMLNYYKVTPIETLKKRWKNISEARRVHLTEEEVLRIEEVLSLGYVKDKIILMKVAEIEGKSYKAFVNYCEDNPGWKEKFPRFRGQMDRRVQNLKPSQFRNLLLDLETMSTGDIKEKWDIGEKTQVRLRNFFTKNDRISRKETRPEKMVRKILESEEIEYKREKYLCRDYRVDFIIGRKVIEVQGDYFHANPIFYSKEEVNKLQERNILNDKKKKEWLLRNNFELLEIWENDLFKKLEETREKIIKYVKEG